MDVLAERILLDLRNTFKKDPLIDEFDVLPVHESVSNKCPVIHVDHKIALEDWCVKHVYVYAYSKFFEWRKKPYNIDSECFLMWTSAILLINPEIETVWNARKEFVRQNLLLPENELKFSELVLSRKPKSSPVYAHRKWVLQEWIRGKCTPCTLQQVVNHELSLCSRVANLYPNNYYAWCHRSWLIQELCHYCHKTVSDELTCTERWTSTHVSDHCGFHYRQFLLSCYSKGNNSTPCPLHGDEPCLNSQSPALATLLRQELSYLSNLQAAYLGHEALWYHRRFLVHEFHKMEQPREQLVMDERGSCKRHKWDQGQQGWDGLQEGVFLRECWTRACDTGEWERTLIHRHIKWLKNVVCWPVPLEF